MILIDQDNTAYSFLTLSQMSIWLSARLDMIVRPDDAPRVARANGYEVRGV